MERAETAYVGTREKAAGLNFTAVAVFIASVFIVSNDNSLRIASVSVSTAAAVLMLAAFLLNGLKKGRFILKAHEAQRPLFLLFFWAVFSLIIARLDPAKAVPEAAYSYSWANGMNSPAWRGVSFILRLFLSVFAIEFIISTVDTKEKVFRVVNITLAVYSLVCLFGLAQIILYFFFHIEAGSVLTEPHFRAGGYVGEPQTYGILIVSTIFLVIAAVNKRCEGVYFSRRFLKALLLMAVIDLVFTFSVSMLVSVLLALLFHSNEIRKRGLILFTMAGGAAAYAFYSFLNSVLIAKLVSETFTYNSRTLTWNIGVKMLGENPVTGVGIGQSPLLSGHFSELINLSFDSLNFDAFRVALLNSYIEWGAETGLVGLAVLLYLIYRCYMIGRARCQSKDFKFVRLAYGGALLALAVSANSYGGVFYIGCFNLVFAMYIAGTRVFSRAADAAAL